MMKPRKLKVMLLTGLVATVFLLAVKTPPERLVLVDGFSMLVQGELLRRGHVSIGLEQSQLFSEIVQDLASKGSRRFEKVPLPPELHQKKFRESKIEASQVPLVQGKDGRFYLPQALGLTMVQSFFYSLHLETVSFCFMSLLLLALWYFVFPSHYYGGNWNVFLLIILFNPLALFYAYHSQTNDWINLLLLGLFLASELRLIEPIVPDKHDNLYIIAALGGISGGLLFLVNPYNILIVIALLMWPAFRRGMGFRRFSGPYVVMCTVTMGLTLILLWFLNSLIPLLEWLRWQPFINMYIPLHPEWRGFPGSVIPTLYLVTRAGLLGLPMLLPALFGFWSNERTLRKERDLLLLLLFLLLIPLFFAERYEFALYMLTGRFLLPLALVLSLEASRWINGRSTGEKIAYVILLVMIGLAGYAFFLARLRIDLWGLGIMEALDYNLNRMFLVFQPAEMIH